MLAHRWHALKKFTGRHATRQQGIRHIRIEHVSVCVKGRQS